MEGLQNLGSTCAINSLIQIICRTSKLRDSILLENIPEDTLSNELKEILDLLYIKNKSISPNKFINSLYSSLEGIFRRGEQIDIGELWTYMFDKIATEISIPYTLQIHENNINNECNNMLYKFNNKKTSKWLETSQGILVNIINCKNCNNTVHNFEPFTSITLDIINDDTPNIIDMLKDFLCTEERLADEWKCEKCNMCSNYSKTVKLWRAPSVIIFIIKRFASANIKDNRYIKINKSICIGINTILEDNKEKIYNLTGIGLHHGILQGGHYNAICHIGNNTFIHYDDLSVNNITADNPNMIDNILEKNNSAYILSFESF